MLVRAAIVAEGVPGGPAGLRRALGELETLGVSRRGYLVDGLGGAQHALPGAIERLREVRDPPAGRPCDRARRERSGQSVRHRPALAGARRGPRLARRRRDSSCCATASRSHSSSAAARTLLSLQPLEDADWAAVAGALATASLEGRVGSLQLERIDGERRHRLAGAAAFTAPGFAAGPKRLTLRARR